MERGRSPRCRARGGEGIPAPRSARARVVAGAAAIALAAVLGAWFSTLAVDASLARASASATLAAILLLATALMLRTPTPIPFGIFALGAQYMAIVGLEGHALDTRAPIVAGGLLAVGELAYWSLELRIGVAEEAGTYLRRISVLATLVLSAVALGAILLAVVEAVAARGVALDVLGAAGAVGVLALLALASRRTGSRSWEGR